LKIKIKIAALLLLALVSNQSIAQNNVTLKYPETEKIQQMDEYFGIKVADPYRWLEQDTAAKVMNWVVKQNAVTQNYLAQIPFRESIRKRITELMNYPKHTVPIRVGEYYIFSKNNGLQNQPVFYKQKGWDGEVVELIDPNKISADGTSAVTLGGASKNGNYLVYTVAMSGGDWQEIRVVDLATTKTTTDRIQWVKFSSPAWFKDGFFYSGYSHPEKGNEFSVRNEFQKIFYHKLGDPQEKDIVVFEDKLHPQRYVYAETTNDEKDLIVTVRDVGQDGYELHHKNLENMNNSFQLLILGFEFEYNLIGYGQNGLIFKTNENAPNSKVVAINPANPAKEKWKLLIPEQKELIKELVYVGNKLFVNYLKDVTSRVYQFDEFGKKEADVSLPGLGTVSLNLGKSQDKYLFYTYTSFTYPLSVFRYEIATAKTQIHYKSELKFNTDDFETKQVFYSSKDGTKVPMFITHKKGLKLNGSNPTMLFAYGGFNISKFPEFESSHMLLLENGGIYAHANIRGGGEYGENWHKAGMQLNKQNVFDDFIAAAEYLINEKYTSPQKLAAIGRSNGGLLIGAVVNQRPDLFQVAFPKVGVMDMLRFQKFTVGWGWINDFGSSDSLRHFKNLFGYSPLHNIKSGINYPAIMVTTADHDDRVVPAHSFKYAATLQEKYKGINPVLLRVDSKSGHGATGKPIGKWIDEQTDIFSFMFFNMDIKL
jgi:prolyl oligopeptidase